METSDPTKPSYKPLEGSRARQALGESGTVFSEYLVITSVVTIGAAAAVLAVGVPFAQYYRFTIALLAIPFP